MKILPQIDLALQLNYLDWSIFIGILLLTFLSIFLGHYRKSKTLHNKKKEEEEHLLDHLIMGRKLTLPLFIATLVATWYGGIFGVTAIAFNKGLFNFLTQGVFWYITYLLFAFIIVDKISQYQAITLPDLVHKMFGPKSSKLSALFNFFNVLPIAYCMALGFFLQLLFGGNLQILMLLGIGFVILYSFGGGLRSVIYSDLIQFFVMCASVLLIFLFSYFQFGGWDFLSQNLPAQHLEIRGGESWGTTFVWGLIALATLVDPNFYQRCFAAKSPHVAKRGIIYSTIIWILFDICTTAGALYAKATIPSADADKAYLIYAIQILPHGLRGFVLAGILATILSTLDSYLFLAGTTLSFDLLPSKWKNKISTQRLGLVIVGIISVLLVPLFDGSIKKVWKILGSYQASCLLFPIFFGYLFPKKISDNQFILISFSGVLATTYWKLSSHHGFWANVDELYIGTLSALVITVLCLFASQKKTKHSHKNKRVK